jgi:hypothetical protein
MFIFLFIYTHFIRNFVICKENIRFFQSFCICFSLITVNMCGRAGCAQLCRGHMAPEHIPETWAWSFAPLRIMRRFVNRRGGAKLQDENAQAFSSLDLEL